MGKKKKRYVSYTPFIQGKNGVMVPINMYTTLEYTVDELMLRLETDEAINFLENAILEVSKYKGSTIFCDMSFFVEASFRKDKNSPNSIPPMDKMLNNDLRKITIRVSILKENTTHYEKREFIVNYDDLKKSLKKIDTSPLKCYN